MLDWDIYKINNKINSPETAESNELNLKNYDLFNSDSFSREAEIWSYACRTGINVDDATDIEFVWGGEKSLAQMIANKLKINVNAYARRSNYGDTWGSWTDRRLLQGANLDEKILPKEKVTYDNKFRDYKEQEIFIGKDNYPWQPQGAYRDVKAGDSPIGPSKMLIKYSPK